MDVNRIVLDLETLHSPDEIPTRWENKAALGLSIGGYYDYWDDVIRWFDAANLESTMIALVKRQPLMVSFNGIAFDYPLMRAVVRSQAETQGRSESDMQALEHMCEAFKTLAAGSYDVLAAVWSADPQSRMVKGINSLESICQANGLLAGKKSLSGGEVPTIWKAGRIAEVMNYCQQDILLTRALVELAIERGGALRRNGARSVKIALPPGDVLW